MPCMLLFQCGTPNVPREIQRTLDIPASHTLDDTSYCTSLGVIGYALNGVPFYNAADGDGFDAFFSEAHTFDGCGGHASPDGS